MTVADFSDDGTPMITHKYVLILVVGIFALVSFVRAADDSNLDAGQQKQKSIQDLHKAQLRLDRAYQAALSVEHDPAKKRQLISSQKAWLAYADSVIAYCYPASDNDWGSGTVTFLNHARMKMIEDRIHVLTPGDVYPN